MRNASEVTLRCISGMVFAKRRHTQTAITLLVALLLVTEWCVKAAELPGPWVQVNRPIASVQLGFVVHDRGVFYTGGSDGLLLASADARAWVQRDVGLTNYLAIGAAGNGRVIVSNGSDLAISKDGLVWEIHPTPGIWFATLAFGNGLFVAGSNTGALLTSTNGVDWVVRRAEDFWENFSEICVGEGAFVALSGDGVFYSETGEQWKEVFDSVATSPQHCVYADGKFLGVDSDAWLWVSADGKEWQKMTNRLSSTAVKLLHDGTQYLAVHADSAQVSVSPDGNQWTLVRSPSSITVKDAIFVDGKLVMVGRAGGILSGPTVTRLETIHAGLDPLFNSVAAGPPGVVAVADTRFIVAFSPDGLSWRGLPLALSSQSRPKFVRYSRGRFVMGGEHGSLWTSPDGETWTSAPLDRDVTLKDLATDGQTEVLTASAGVVLYSTNGVEWIPGTVPYSGSAVAWGGGNWVCLNSDVPASYNTFVLHSTNGREWTKAYVAGVQLKSLTYANGQFVAVGNWGAVATSPDGVAWTKEPPATPDHLSSITYHQGWYLATVQPLPERSTLTLPAVLLSTNAVDWVAGPIETRRSRQLAAAGASFGDVAWVVGEGGMIRRVGPIQAPEVGLQRAADRWRFSATTPQHVDLSLESSEDFRTWQNVGLILNPTPVLEFEILTPGDATRRFYRAVAR